VIDRRADRVLRHCSSCKLSWTADADLAANGAASEQDDKQRT
jgi:hypothetical protein